MTTEHTRQVTQALDLTNTAGILGHLDYSNQWLTTTCAECGEPAAATIEYGIRDWEDGGYAATDEDLCADHAHEHATALTYREDLNPDHGIHITLSGWWLHYNQQQAVAA